MRDEGSGMAAISAASGPSPRLEAKELKKKRPSFSTEAILAAGTSLALGAPEQIKCRTLKKNFINPVIWPAPLGLWLDSLPALRPVLGRLFGRLFY